MVLTDINNTSCAFQFVQTCRRLGVKPVLGLEFREKDRLRYIGIARNEEGFRELCALLSRCSLQGEPIPRIAPVFKHAFVVYQSLPRPIEDFAEHEYYGIRPEEVNGLFRSDLSKQPDPPGGLCPLYLFGCRWFQDT